jgi:hypothetical protein
MDKLNIYKIEGTKFKIHPLYEGLFLAEASQMPQPILLG